MQVFPTSRCPRASAKRLWADPVRARKMIVECMQLLACAQAEYDMPIILKLDGNPYSTPNHIRNHPAGKWVRANRNNVRWLTEHLKALRAGYKGDKFTNVLDAVSLLRAQFGVYSAKDVVCFDNNAKKGASNPDLDFTHIADVHEAYDLYLKAQGA